MTRNDLLALAERVEQGRDNLLLGDIHHALRLQVLSSELLTSLDAVEALRSRLLPGSLMRMAYSRVGWEWSVMAPCYLWASAVADTPARCYLAALLRAYSETVEG